MYEQLGFDTTYRKRIIELLNEGFKIGADGKLEPVTPIGVLNLPWLFINNDARRKFCRLWNGVYCGKFHLIPTFCRFNCWKTVIYPNNVHELFQLASVLKMLDLPSKCGSDVRDYTPAAWDGFIYGDTLEEGREYYAKARKAVDLAIGKHVKIILKRGCTEMERLRPSDTWDDHSDDEKALERQLDDLFHFNEINFVQSKWLINQIKEGWIKRAISFGDPTAKQTAEEYSGNPDIWKQLTVNAVTYHEDK